MIVEELVTKLGLEIDGGALATLERFRSAVSSGMAGLAAGAAAATAAFVGIVGATAKAADDVGDLAEKLGVNAQALQELRVAAELSDVSFESLATGLKFIAKNAAEAAHSGGEAADAFKGIQLRDANGQIKSADQLLTDVARRFETVTDTAEQTRIAVKIFGRGGVELLPLLRRGAEGIEAFRAEAQELGAVFGEEALQQADDYGRELVRLKFAFEGLRNAFGVPFIGAFRGVLTGLLGVLKGLRPFVTRLADAFKNDLGPRISRVAAVVNTLVQAVVQASGVLGRWVSSLAENVDGIKILEAVLLGLGVTAVIAAAKTVAAWLVAGAPFILLAALIGVVVDEIATLIEGGDSLTKSIEDWAKAADPNNHPLIKLLKAGIKLVFDLTDPKRWRAFASEATAALAEIVKALPGGRFKDFVFGTVAGQTSRLINAGANLAEAQDLPTALGFTRQGLENNPAFLATRTDAPPPLPVSSVASLPQVPVTIQAVNVNASGMSPEEGARMVTEGIRRELANGLAGVSGGAN